MQISSDCVATTVSITYKYLWPGTHPATPSGDWVYAQRFILMPLCTHYMHTQIVFGSDVIFAQFPNVMDRLCGLVVRVLGYRSGGPGLIPSATRFSER
jgi:hypothetical protein